MYICTYMWYCPAAADLLAAKVEVVLFPSDSSFNLFYLLHAITNIRYCIAVY